MRPSVQRFGEFAHLTFETALINSLESGHTGMTIKTKVNLLISLAILVLALPAAVLADLRVAIDDGHAESELFVYLDELDSLRASLDGAASAAPAWRASDNDACDPDDGRYTLRESLAITSQADFFMMRGVTIFSEDAIDAETRDEIRELLANAGHDDEVIFFDGSRDSSLVEDDTISH